MTCPPTNPYLIKKLQSTYILYTLHHHQIPNAPTFVPATHAPSIRAVVDNSAGGADARLIDQLPRLEIVANDGVGYDKMDLVKCRERGIRGTIDQHP